MLHVRETFHAQSSIPFERYFFLSFWLSTKPNLEAAEYRSRDMPPEAFICSAFMGMHHELGLQSSRKLLPAARATSLCIKRALDDRNSSGLAHVWIFLRVLVSPETRSRCANAPSKGITCACKCTGQSTRRRVRLGYAHERGLWHRAPHLRGKSPEAFFSSP